MHGIQHFSQQVRWTVALRRGAEYAAVIGLALLSSYWIVRGRW